MAGFIIASSALFLLYAFGPGPALVALGVGAFVWQICRDKKRIAQLEKRTRRYH